MTITFQCEHCRKEVKAPDTAGGKRGRCPYCNQEMYVPAPVSDEQVLPPAPQDRHPAPPPVKSRAGAPSSPSPTQASRGPDRPRGRKRAFAWVFGGGVAAALLAVAPILLWRPGSGGWTFRQSEEVSELLEKVKDVSQFEKAKGSTQGVFGALFGYNLGILAAAEAVQQRGLEREAVAALSRLAAERKNSRNKWDPFVCSGIVTAVSQFKNKPDLVLPVMRDLRNHPDKMVSDAAREAIEKMGAADAPKKPNNDVLHDPVPPGRPASADGAQEEHPTRAPLSSLCAAYAPKCRFLDDPEARSPVRSGRIDRMTKYAGIGGPEIGALMEALASKGQDVPFVEAYGLLPSIVVLYDDENKRVLQQDFAQFVARIKNLPTEEIDLWSAAADTMKGLRPLAYAGPKVHTIFFLSQTERLWAGASYQAQASRLLQSRIRSVPRGIIEEWSEAEQLSPLLTALWIAQTDCLFQKDRFDTVRAQQAIAALRSPRR